MKTLQVGTSAVLLMIGLFSVANAEYLIYLKGGHYIVADDCTFSAGSEGGNSSEGGEQPIGVDELNSDITGDCTQGKPEGRIFWRTINGNVGEVNADDVYAIFGSKSLPSIKPSGSTMPLEDYLITNRDESFVNAKTLEQTEVDVYALKRDELSKVNRRWVSEITPERLAKSRSGEELCSGEPPEFAVSEVDVVEGHLLGSVTNRSKELWHPELEVEVRVRGRFMGKFEVKDRNALGPNESRSIDAPVDPRFLKELEKLKDADAGVRLCYRKIKTTTGSPVK
jgi:hypothetical protein